MATARTLVAAPDPPPDITLFAGDINTALHAFSVDASYAVAMARSAVTITRKRAVWQARKELRDAEARAHTECADTTAFECHATAACGVGDCKFAVGEHATLTVIAAAGASRRPQYPYQSYSVEQAVAALADRRRTPR
jgi:hypothetical protein